MTSCESISLYERLGATDGIAGAVDILVDRLFANANFVGVPAAEHQEFMEIIESYRGQV
jgi:hypothetical protein